MREIPRNKLNKKIVNVWRISGLITTVIIATCVFSIALVLYFAAEQSSLWILLAGIITVIWLVAFVIVIPPIRYRRWRYDVHAEEVDIYSGIIIRKRIIIPLVRVQFTDTKQGPIMRSFGLAQVSVSTAGGEKNIPGLLIEDADALRDKVAKLASIAREEV